MTTTYRKKLVTLLDPLTAPPPSPPSPMVIQDPICQKSSTPTRANVFLYIDNIVFPFTVLRLGGGYIPLYYVVTYMAYYGNNRT